MYTYTCCRCTKCDAQIVLEDRADANLIYKLPRPLLIRQGLSILPSSICSPELLRKREWVASHSAWVHSGTGHCLEFLLKDSLSSIFAKTAD